MTTIKPPLRNPLHVFRGILREAGYHPDLAARSYLKSYARHSFRANIAKAESHTKWTAEAKWEREMHVMRKARNLHSVLQRSNQGYLEPFRKTLSWTYARKGRRRYFLMRQIMRIRSGQENPSDKKSPLDTTETSPTALAAPTLLPDESTLDTEHHSSMTATTEPAISQPQNNNYFAYGPGISAARLPRHRPHNSSEIPPMFQALSASHAKVGELIPEQSSTNKPNGPQLPATTIWNRPMPECRVRNGTLKWFAAEAARLYPYLPPEEWSHIRDIASGSLRLIVPPRRPTASKWVFTSPDPEPVPSLLAPPRAEPRYRGQKYGNPHRLTSRFLAHQYEWLLRHIPLLIGGEGEAAYGSAPTVPPLANQAETRDAGPSQEAENGEEAVGATDTANSTLQQARAEALSRRSKPLGTFLWHSTVLDKPKPPRLVPQSLNGQMNKLLFD